MTPSTTAPAQHVWRGLLLVCLAAVVWGTIGPAVQVVHDRSSLSVLVIGAYRATAAVAALVLAAVTTDRLRASLVLARAHWRRVIVVGVMTAVFQLLFFVAVVSIGVSVATVVCLGFAPVLLLAVSSAQRRRLPSLARVATVTTAVAGLLLVSLAGGGGDAAPHTTLGVLAALGSGSAYALATDVGAPLSHSHDAIPITVLTMSVAAVVLVPGGLALAYARGDTMTTGDGWSWLLLVYLGVITMAFAYVLLFAGLRSTPSGSVVVATLLEPVTAVLIAVLFLDETLTVAGVVGSALILLAISSLGRQEVEPAPQ